MPDAKKSVVDTLTRRERLWLEFYLQTMNATEAARLAGYKHPNTQGPRLSQHRKMKDAIEERLAEAAASADEVLATLTNHMRGSMGDFLKFDEGGNFEVDLNQASDRGQLRLVKKIFKHKNKTVTENGHETETEQVRVELYDAQAAAVQLGRYWGLFTDKTDLTSGGEVIKPVLYLPDNGRGK